MRCYQMEDHSTAQCELDQSYEVCSECGSSTHGWRECSAPVKKCLNCDGTHSTLATRCPKRKEIINKKRKADQNKENVANSSILKKKNSNQVEILHSLSGSVTVTASTHTTIFQAMLHSHFVNIANPGSYSKTFNELMKANNLPTMNFPEEPLSLEIITRLSVATNVDSGQAASLRVDQYEKEKEKVKNTLRVTYQR